MSSSRKTCHAHGFYFYIIIFEAIIFLSWSLQILFAAVLRTTMCTRSSVGCCPKVVPLASSVVVALRDNMELDYSSGESGSLRYVIRHRIDMRKGAVFTRSANIAM